MLREVVSAACEAVNADPSVQAWLSEATARCEEGVASLPAGGELPPGVVSTVVFSSLAPRRLPGEAAEHDENA